MQESKQSFGRRVRDMWRQMRQTPNWLEAIEGRLWSHADETRGFKYFVKRHLQILDSSIRSFRAHDSMTKASALTYTSILTMVPLLAIVLSLLKGLGMFESAHNAINHMFDQMLAVAGATKDAYLSIHQIVDQVFDIVEKTDFSKLGLTAVFGLLLAAMSLLSRVEVAMNDVWSVHKSRPLGRKIVDYINMVLVLALMLLATSGAAGNTIIKFSGKLAQLEQLQKNLLGFLPYVITWLAFIFLFHYMPNTRVRWRSAIVSGLLSGIIFQLLQLGFFAMATRTLAKWAIYGAFGTVLFLLFWIWFSWCIVLWGVEFCNAHQNIRDWRRRRRPWFGTPAERETLALRLAALLAAPMLDVDAQRPALDTGELADELKVPSEPVGEVLDLFENNGLVTRTEEGAFVFVRSPERVSMLDIIRLVRHGRLHVTPAKMWETAHEKLTAELGAHTIKDLAGRPLDSIQTYSL
ncbi:MAG: YhjD/YihY/BrkB family envelope integrity protein [Candidatus Sumerlaeia bacterium]